MITRRRFLDDNDDDDVVRDGERVRRSMLAWDSRTAVIDYCSDDPFLAAHRPGYRRSLDASVRDASERARAQAIRDACDAWKSPQRIEQDREAACIAARDEVIAAGDAEKIHDQAYWRMVEEARNAWKSAS